MELIDSFLLGLLQGLTEFLPISSSGHLVLAEAFLGGGGEKGLTFEVVVHFGTLCSILIYYRQKLTDIVRSWVRLAGSDSYKIQYQEDPNLKLTAFVLITMIPAGIIGLAFKDEIEQYFMNPFMVSCMLLVTGAILMLTYLRKTFPNHLNYKNTFIIGLAQAFAILPGISRSGSTISTGLYLGVKREEAADFSFLMVIPVIAGAMLLEVIEMFKTEIAVDDSITLVVGFITALVTGYFALKYLIIILKRKGIYPFGWYCWALGAAGLIYFW